MRARGRWTWCLVVLTLLGLTGCTDIYWDVRDMVKFWDPPSQYTIGLRNKELGDYRGAIIAFRDFIKQHPKSKLVPWAFLHMADCLERQQPPLTASAISGYERLIKEYPDSEAAKFAKEWRDMLTASK